MHNKWQISSHIFIKVSEEKKTCEYFAANSCTDEMALNNYLPMPELCSSASILSLTSRQLSFFYSML